MNQQAISIDVGNLNHVITTQIKSFYPRRLADYQAGRLEVKVHVIETAADDEWYKQQKQIVSINDPSCTLIMGFNKATLFLGRYLVDTPEKKRKTKVTTNESSNGTTAK